MTEKELNRLKRQDLLQLLFAQGTEFSQLQKKVAELEIELSKATAMSERLKDKLDDKDDQIERLKDKLNDKDDQIERFKDRLQEKDEQRERLKKKLDDKDVQIDQLTTELEKIKADRKLIQTECGTLAEAALKLSGIFEAAQEAADIYLENLKA